MMSRRQTQDSNTQGSTKKEWDIIKEEDIEGQNSSFTFSYTGLSTEEAERLQRIHGYNELPEKNPSKLLIFFNLLTEAMPLMIWVAIFIEFLLGQYMDMSILLFIQFSNATIAFYETNKSNSAIKVLKNSLKPLATVCRDGKWTKINNKYLVPGDLISVGNGSAIPADIRINEGHLEVDQSALTGESIGVKKSSGDSCQMGSTVIRGEVEGTVEFIGEKTFLGRTAMLLQPDNELSNLQNMLMDIMIVLVVISLTLCSVVYLHLSSITSFVEALSFTIVLMIASIPLAIEIVTTTTLSLGSKELSKHGAIVTRLSAIEDMASMSILCSDKTGTLTINKMSLVEESCIIFNPNYNVRNVLEYAALGTKWWEPPKDALDTLTLSHANIDWLNSNYELMNYLPFDPTVKRTESVIKNKNTGEIFKTSKGAPHVILRLVNDKNIIEIVENEIRHLGNRGIRSLAVARTYNIPIANYQAHPMSLKLVEDELPTPQAPPGYITVWRLVGILTFLDPPRPDTLQTIRDAHSKCGVMVKMVTGDHHLIAKEMSRVLELGTNILTPSVLPTLEQHKELVSGGTSPSHASQLTSEYSHTILSADGFAEVFPEHKYLIVNILRESGYKVGMTGDGVNDAPALKRADIGVAVSGSTDAARAAADIVLTQPGLSTIIEGIQISRCIFIRIKNFITYRIAATLQLLLFFFIAIFSFQPSDYEPSLINFDGDYSKHNTLVDGIIHSEKDHFTWPSFFHMPVMMLMLITLLNDGTLIAIGYDYVLPPSKPTLWNLKVLFIIGSVLALVACISSLFLLHLLLSSWSKNSLLMNLGMGKITYGQITTSIFLKVAVSDFLTLFSSRAGEDWCFPSFLSSSIFSSPKYSNPKLSSSNLQTPPPAPILLISGCFALTMSTLFACFWPDSSPDGVPTLGLLMTSENLTFSSNTTILLPIFIWVYCLIWWVIQDAAKVYVCRFLKKYDILGYNETGMVLNQRKPLSSISDTYNSYSNTSFSTMSTSSSASNLNIYGHSFPNTPNTGVSHAPQHKLLISSHHSAATSNYLLGPETSSLLQGKPK